MQNNQTSEWLVTDDNGKGKLGMGKARENTTKARAKARQNIGKRKHHGKKGKKGSHEMEGHDDTQDAQTSHYYTAWTDTKRDHGDIWSNA